MIQATRQERAQAAVEAMLEDARISSYPVDLHALAASRGATVRTVSSNDMGGLLGHVAPVDDGLEITVNADLPDRSRFTLAHEIAHTLVSPEMGGNRANVKDPKTHQALERLCDQIASEILMPTKWFKPFVLRYPLNIDLIVELARRFQTSIQSAAIRVTNFVPQYIEVLCWTQEGDDLAAKWSAGRPKLANPSTRPKCWRSVSGDSGPAQALRRPGSVVSKECSARGAPYVAESRRFGSNQGQFVLSVVKPMVAEAEIAAAQRIADARARYLRAFQRPTSESIRAG